MAERGVLCELQVNDHVYERARVTPAINIYGNWMHRLDKAHYKIIIESQRQVAGLTEKGQAAVSTLGNCCVGTA